MNWTFTAEIRGHKVTCTDGINWFYDDDGGLCDENDRPCTKCGILAAHDEPDPCLGWLEGVDYACCGHGNPRYEYVKVGDTRYDSVEAWRLDTERGTIITTTDRQEV